MSSLTDAIPDSPANDQPPPVTDLPTVAADTDAQLDLVIDRSRLMIPVSQLAAHPGNVRADLDLNTEFCASVAEVGVRIPLLVTPDDGWGSSKDTAAWPPPSRPGWPRCPATWIPAGPVMRRASTWTC